MNDETDIELEQTCRCGASFKAHSSGYVSLLAEPSASKFMRDWELDHANICEHMANQIAPREDRKAAWQAETTAQEEARREKQREYNRRAKEKRQAEALDA